MNSYRPIRANVFHHMLIPHFSVEQTSDGTVTTNTIADMTTVTNEQSSAAQVTTETAQVSDTTATVQSEVTTDGTGVSTSGPTVVDFSTTVQADTTIGKSVIQINDIPYKLKLPTLFL